MGRVVIDRDGIVGVLRGREALGMQAAEVTSALGLGREHRPAVRRALKELVRRGILLQDGRHFRLDAVEPPAEPPVVGALRVTPAGRGFVVPLDPSAEGISVDAEDLAGAIDGDTVELQLDVRQRRPRGRIVRVVRRERRRITGLLRGPPWEVVPADARLVRPIALRDAPRVRPQSERSRHSRAQGRLTTGQVVVADIVAYPERPGDALEVTVTRALGDPGSVLTEVARVLAEQWVDEPFPAAVRHEAEATVGHVRPADLVDRVDLRDRPFITIDPETARDFDDAVAVEPGPHRAMRIWVAVADVSHYVQPGSAIDREAEVRGFSLYLPDRAIPMLPEALSSGICSLVPNKDRLAMVVRLDVDERGYPVEAECMAGVIHSRGRLDYAGVAAALGGQLRGKWGRYREHLDQLEQLRRVASMLRQRRLARGSLDLDLPEAKVVLDEDDPALVRDIVSTRADSAVRAAYNMIEEVMIAANEAVGRSLEAENSLAMWRVHDVPSDRALLQLCEWLASYGINADAEQLSNPKAMARLLRDLRGHPAARPLTYLLLRSLKQANYRIDNPGHFGLASSCYLHFTSPIRRYPDLLVHRLVKRRLREQGHAAGGRQAAEAEIARSWLQAAAEQASGSERRALDVTRQVHSVYAAHLMRDRIGDEFGGTVSGLAAFGIFVTLEAPAIDGMVRIESLPEAMRFDARRQRLFGRRTGCTVSLGDAVRVKVIDASVTRRQVDLELLEHQGRAVHEWTRAGGARKGDALGRRRRRRG